MPTTAILNLRAVSATPLPRSFHCLMHPVFLERIARVDGPLAQKLHDANTPLPFSLSPIMGAGKKVMDNRSYWVRIGILNSELESAFLTSMEQGVWREPLRLESNFFEIEDIAWGAVPGNPWSGSESYAQLLDDSQEVSKVTLTIASPLSFKRGDLNYPLPEIALIFGNLTRRWNFVAACPLPENLDGAAVSFSAIDLKTKPFAVRRGGTILGVVGKLTFVFGGSPQERKLCHTLLRFAFYAGLGVKTAQGMGMCRIIRTGGRS